MSPGGDLPVPSMRTMPCRNPHQEVSCHCAEVISCDKSWLQEATPEFNMFTGGEQVHSYLGIPVLHSETNTSLNWDNACLTYWTSHLALNSHSFLKGKKQICLQYDFDNATVMFHFIQKGVHLNDFLKWSWWSWQTALYFVIWVLQLQKLKGFLLALQKIVRLRLQVATMLTFQNHL